ncbi:O-antigen ligase family protein [Thiosocius teredinicola]|uniref:O-antigen ligase family protein n=1 Tax=Thiosocius teredinicola TaxID=1973002 RepID=UPI00099134B5
MALTNPANNVSAGARGLPATRPYLWYALIPALMLFVHALELDELYRAFVYGNVFVVAWIAYRLHRRDGGFPTGVAAALLLPAALLTVLYITSGHEIAGKEIRHLVAFTFVAIGCLLLPMSTKHLSNDQHRVQLLVVALVIAYAVIQIAAIFIFEGKYGTTKNPHYLAHYALLLLVIAPLLYRGLPPYLKVALSLAVVLLGVALLHSFSRPAWLSFLLTGLLYVWLMRGRISWRWPVAIVFLLGAIYLYDIGGVGKRVDDLLGKITAEERVTIWRDAWNMQSTSTARQWVVGHGIDSFEEDFKAYSDYHHQGIDFNAPHNMPLELLYTVGIVGLVLVAATIAYVYLLLFRAFKQLDRSPFAATLIAVLTANLLFISITVSFFSSHHLLVFSLIAGLAVAFAREKHRVRTDLAGT